VNAPASHVDLVPTVLDLLRLPAAAGLPGRSLLASMDGHEGAAPAPASYFEALSASLNRGWAPLRGVVAGREKYIDLPLPELYDLGSDPDEKANLVDARQERQRALDLTLRAIPASAAATERQSTDPEAAERLRALGYVTGNAAPKARYTEADDPKRLIGVDQNVHRAIDLYQRGRAAEAVPIYQQMIASHPMMDVAYTHLAMLQWELGSPDAAIATLRAALAAGVKSVVILTKLGTYLAESGHGSDAVPILQEAVSGDLPDLDALNALGIALARAGRTEEAAVQFTRILQTSSTHAMALENLGSIALEKQDYADARAFFTRALATDPSSAQAHNGLGVVEMQSGNRRAAIEHWKAAVATDPANFYALYNVAIQLVADGRRDEARPYVERFARTAPPALYAADIRRVQALLAR
jgi:tetratricopeptide (TPR) repeat protein